MNPRFKELVLADLPRGTSWFEPEDMFYYFGDIFLVLSEATRISKKNGVFQDFNVLNLDSQRKTTLSINVHCILLASRIKDVHQR